MKKICCVIIALMLCMASAAMAETTIRVLGNGVVLTSADVATVTLGVSMNHQDVKKAQAMVNETLADIRKVLIENGLSKEAISTSSVSLYSMWTGNESDDMNPYYNASSNLTIRTSDLDSVGKLIDLAFSAGANSLYGVEFGLSDSSSAQEQALRLALQNAGKQAEIIADETGLIITGIEEIIENGSYNYGRTGLSNYSKMEMSAADGAEETVVQPEKLRIEASVEVIYSAESKP